MGKHLSTQESGRLNGFHNSGFKRRSATVQPYPVRTTNLQPPADRACTTSCQACAGIRKAKVAKPLSPRRIIFKKVLTAK